MVKFFFIISCFLAIQDEPVISWAETYKLSWSDFKSEANNEVDAVALTASGISFGMSVRKSDNVVVSYKANIQAHFYPEKSWYNKDKADEHILAHEQLHFNITELYVRKFRQQIEAVKVSNNVREQLNTIHNQINKDISQMQIKYDAETNHSRNMEAQAKWQLYIEAELKKLSKHKSVD